VYVKIVLKCDYNSDTNVTCLEKPEIHFVDTVGLYTWHDSMVARNVLSDQLNYPKSLRALGVKIKY
jgi:hypothetical protein